MSAWVGRSLAPLSGVDPTDSVADLERLDALFRHRRVIAIGEATHGTREFFRLKDRVFRYLVQKHGFTLLALEMPQHHCAALDDYVHGRGADDDIVALLAKGTFFAGARSIVDLLRWMRATNAKAAPERQLALVGFDIQEPCASRDVLLGYLEKSRPVLYRQHATWLEELPMRAAGARGVGHIHDALAQLRRGLEAPPGAKVSDAERRAHRHARAALEVLAQNLAISKHCKRTQRGCSAAKREAFMARNVLAEIEQRGAKALVWAHNRHVAQRRHRDGWAPMGYYLRRRLEESLLIVGLEFGRGRFVAPAGGVGQVSGRALRTDADQRPLAEYELGAPPPNSLSHLFALQGHEVFLLDLRPARGDRDLDRFFEARRELHQYGDFAPSKARHFTRALPVHRAFDALIFVAHVQAFRQVAAPAAR